MAKLETSKGVSFFIDDSDIELVSKYKWSYGSSGSNSYFKARVEGKTMYLHRLILGAQKGNFVDHIDRDTKNNRRENLRFVNKAQNNANCNRNKNKPKWEYRGIDYFSKKTKPWRAQISCKSVRHVSKYCKTMIEAALEYDSLAKKLFGEFAVLNFPGRSL